MATDYLNDLTPPTAEQVRAAWDHPTTLACRATAKGYFEATNTAFEQTLGYGQNELAGVPFITLVHPDDHDETVIEVAKLLRGQDVVAFRNRYRTRDEQWVHLEWRAHWDEVEQLIYALATAVEVTADDELQLIESLIPGHAQNLRPDVALLRDTFAGAAKALVDLLSLTHPSVGKRAWRVKTIVDELCAELKIDDAWKVGLAAVFSQVGVITIPEPTLEAFRKGRTVSEKEREDYRRHPEVGKRLLLNIPRLEEIAGIVGAQNVRFEDLEVSDSLESFGTRILKVALDYDELIEHGTPPPAAFKLMQHRAGDYDPGVLTALVRCRGEGFEVPPLVLCLHEVRPGMITAENLHSRSDALILGTGQVMTVDLLDGLRRLLPSTTLVKVDGAHLPLGWDQSPHGSH